MQQEQVGIYSQGAIWVRGMFDWNGKLLVGDIKGRRILVEGRPRTKVGDEDFDPVSKVGNSLSTDLARFLIKLDYVGPVRTGSQGRSLVKVRAQRSPAKHC